MGAEAVFPAVSDPVRRAVLDALAEGEKSVSELLEPFSFSQPAMSQHLRVLREAGLVSSRKDGRRRLYRLEAAPLRELYDWVGHYERFWSERFDRLGQLLDTDEGLGGALEPVGSRATTHDDGEPNS